MIVPINWWIFFKLSSVSSNLIRNYEKTWLNRWWWWYLQGELGMIRMIFKKLQKSQNWKTFLCMTKYSLLNTMCIRHNSGSILQVGETLAYFFSNCTDCPRRGWLYGYRYQKVKNIKFIWRQSSLIAT